jgi:hypothetical protein
MKDLADILSGMHAHTHTSSLSKRPGDLDLSGERTRWSGDLGLVHTHTAVLVTCSDEQRQKCDSLQ